MPFLIGHARHIVAYGKERYKAQCINRKVYDTAANGLFD